MKFRITVTTVFEYEVNPEHYHEPRTPDAMLAHDVGAHQDPIVLADAIRNEYYISLDVQGAIVTEEGSHG